MPVHTIASSGLRLIEPLRMAAARLGEIIPTRHIALLLKLGVSVGAIVLIGRQIDGATLVACLSTQAPWWIVATMLLGLVQIGLLGLRWQQILKGLGGESGLGSALAVTYMGCFFGAFLFGPTGSDVARAVLASPCSLGRRGIVHSVLFERFASVVGLGLAATPVMVFGIGPLARGLPIVATLVLVPLAFLALAAVLAAARTLDGRAGPLFHALRELDQSWRRLVRSWPRLAAAVLIAAIGQALVAVEAWCLARSLNLDVSLIDLSALMPPVMLLVALPISMGGWGVREGAMVASLALVGVGTAPALLLSVELGLIGTLVSLPGGAIWLHRCFSRSKSANLLA